MEHIDPISIKRDTRSSCPCDFCRQWDPHFAKRRHVDQLVALNRRHTASSHLTEDGYVRHRMLELGRIAASPPQTAA